MYVVSNGLEMRTCKSWEAVVRYLSRHGLEPGETQTVNDMTFVYGKPSAQLELFGAGDYAPADTLF